MDLYVVLGVTREATTRDIKRAYRHLARQCHPDINPGDRIAEARFRQIVVAYETLTDPDRRTRYDTGQHVGAAPGVVRTAFQGFDFSVRGVDYSAAFGDLVAEVVTDRRADGRQAPTRGADLHHHLQVSLEEALRGVERAVAITRRVPCGACAGVGLAGAAAVACGSCQGAGTLRSVRGHMVFARTCPACGGSGERRASPCGSCAGAGHLTRTDVVRVRVPPGVADGAHLRLGGEGDAGRHGAPAGDLFVRIAVLPHAIFTRDGDDLRMTVPVAIHEGALGCRIDIPTFDGDVRVKVPPGARSGQCLRARGRGMPSPRTGERGDVVAEIRLMLPAVLDERSKALLREFGRLQREDVRADIRRRVRDGQAS